MVRSHACVVALLPAIVRTEGFSAELRMFTLEATYVGEAHHMQLNLIRRPTLVSSGRPVWCKDHLKPQMQNLP
jgi:hypothetical protein